jgi:hypothetical protein
MRWRQYSDVTALFRRTENLSKRRNKIALNSRSLLEQSVCRSVFEYQFQYRVQAAERVALVSLNANKSSSERWLKVAEEWSHLVDELERRDNPNT